MSFNFREEYGTEAVQDRGMFALTQQEEEELQRMMDISSSSSSPSSDEEGEEENLKDAPSCDLFSFPDCIIPMVEYLHDEKSNTYSFKFLKQKIPETFPFTAPNLLLGLDSISEINAEQRLVLSGVTCLPILVHSSPIVSFFSSKTEANVVVPWKPKYVNWMYSAHQLREFMFLAETGLIPVPPNTPMELAKQCKDDFIFQIGKYDEELHDQIQDLFRVAHDDPTKTQECILKFIEYMEKSALFYIHCLERFIYSALIEPHGSSNITLDDVLTPNDRPTLNQCNDVCKSRELVNDYFQTKVPALQKKDKERAEKDYTFQDTVNLKELPNRIKVNEKTGQVHYSCPDNQVYRGYITLTTIYEYWLFWDTSQILGKDWHQRWNLSMWKF